VPFFGSPASPRSLERRVAAAWILLLLSWLILPATSSRDPCLLRHAASAYAIDIGMAAKSPVLTVRTIIRGGSGMRTFAVACALLAGWRLAAWLVLIVASPTSQNFPLSD